MACQIGGALTASLTPWIATLLDWTAALGTAATIALIGAAAWTCVSPRGTVGRRAADHAAGAIPVLARRRCICESLNDR
jgi:ACS family glucarate transporter-like MFS transporter